MDVPAYGYSTYILKENDTANLDKEEYDIVLRVEKNDEYILENEYIMAKFNHQNALLESLIDKKSGKEMINSKRCASLFRLIEEDDCKGMTSWIVGRYMRVFDLNVSENVRIIDINTASDSIRQWLKYEISYRDSKITVMISLNKYHKRLEYDIECDWQEKAVKGQFIPQLNFFISLGYDSINYKYDIPFGVIEREALNMDVPANSWIMGIPKENLSSALMLVTQTKYGFRGVDNAIAVTLIRSSYDPDPCPENGTHKIKFAINIVDNSTNSELIKQAFDYNHPVKFLSGMVQKGMLPLVKSFICEEEGSFIVSAVKMPESGLKNNGIIIRVYETEGKRTNAVLRFAEKVKKVHFVDINEESVNSRLKIRIKGEKIEFEVDAYSVMGVYIEFEI